MWSLLAKLLARPAVADWLIDRAKRTVYFHLVGYMNRWWLFNGYGEDHIPKHPWLKRSGRVNHILRADADRHYHDHPFNVRTFILKGWYVEERENGDVYLRKAGDTATLKFGEYHRIIAVSSGGVWTLFVVGPKIGEWGFKVDGKKVIWTDYLGE
jgi:hypothetical protein